jgi:hypothetical protein
VRDGSEGETLVHAELLLDEVGEEPALAQIDDLGYLARLRLPEELCQDAEHLGAAGDRL